jgi:hypothetical protein
MMGCVLLITVRNMKYNSRSEKLLRGIWFIAQENVVHVKAGDFLEAPNVGVAW